MDKSLEIVLNHEYYRFKLAFNRFCTLYSELRPTDGKDKKIDCYNHYVDFVSHLYEFYMGHFDYALLTQEDFYYKACDYNPKKQRKNVLTDCMLNMELAKLCRNRKDRLERGIDDILTRESSYYDNVPTKFGEHFRFIRNMTNHSSIRRVDESADISLTVFFNTYHKYMLIMYYEAMNFGNMDVELYKWHEIEEFVDLIFKTNPN